MFDTFIMTDNCLSLLATSGGSLRSHDQLVEFLQPFGVDKYAKDISICLQKNRPALENELPGFELPSKADRSATLKDFRASKKIKHFDDPVAAEEAAMEEKRDCWLTEMGRAGPAVKARMKKVAKAEKKLLEDQEKLRSRERESSALD